MRHTIDRETPIVPAAQSLRMVHLLAVTALIVAGALALPAGPAVGQEEDWRTLLRQQLLSQYDCKLDRFVFEREVPVGKDNSREGRIQCADGREIDYAQPNILLRFELRLCSPTVC
jgi:hypothetical protein